MTWSCYISNIRFYECFICHWLNKYLPWNMGSFRGLVCCILASYRSIYPYLQRLLKSHWAVIICTRVIQSTLKNVGELIIWNHMDHIHWYHDINKTNDYRIVFIHLWYFTCIILLLNTCPLCPQSSSHAVKYFAGNLWAQYSIVICGYESWEQ